jgi:hypothetical protein
MKNKLYIHLFLFLFCTIIFQCKKTGYEEGPKRSLRSTENKLNHTAWELEYYGVNGVDSLSQFPLNPCCIKWEFYIQKDGYQEVAATGVSSVYSIGKIASFETDPNNILIIDGRNPTNHIRYNPFIPDTIINWKIIKFYPKKNLWLSTKYRSKNFFLKFTSISYPL